MLTKLCYNLFWEIILQLDKLKFLHSLSLDVRKRRLDFCLCVDTNYLKKQEFWDLLSLTLNLKFAKTCANLPKIIRKILIMSITEKVNVTKKLINCEGLLLIGSLVQILRRTYEISIFWNHLSNHLQTSGSWNYVKTCLENRTFELMIPLAWSENFLIFALLNGG